MVPDQLRDLSEHHGIQGLILPNLDFPRDLRNLQTLANIAPTENFQFFCQGLESMDAAALSPLSLIHI